MSAPVIELQPPGRWLWVRRNIATALRNLLRQPRITAKPMWRAYARLAPLVGLAIVAVVLTMVFIDVTIIRMARQVPRWLFHVFDVISDFGVAQAFLFPLGGMLVLIAVITAPPLERMSQAVLACLSVRLAFLFLAVAFPGLVVTVVKRVVGRARPGFGNDDVFLFQFFRLRVEFSSFPSGHATTAAAAAIAFGLLWPRLRTLVWTYALIIGLSRVIVKAHHPSDIIAGACFGIVGALLVRDWMAARRLGFTIRNDGTVAPLPGPSWSRIRRVARAPIGQ
ncbi:MAG: phosphatase PAP2 family protein [Hyphomicrobiales bacterium]|nr:phosphatase PAP2 family protein [Hyphomicrobiales bacterium]